MYTENHNISRKHILLNLILAPPENTINLMVILMLTCASGFGKYIVIEYVI